WTLPPKLTASTGLDALTQLLEAFVCNQPNPLTDSLCREGLRRAAGSLQKAYENGDDHDAREDMCLASLFSGMTLANAKLGAVHGLAGTIGGMFPAPHGMVCACLLPYVMDTNIRALQDRLKDSPALERYQEFARIVTGKSRSAVSKGLEWVEQLCSSLSVQPLSEYGVTEEDIPAIVEKAMKSSSMKGNPILLTEEELQKTLAKALFFLTK
ncbi:MAG TPA: iron-containing alcohol dehydrogenase, partial [bacterium]|nr:iron-containing alcohol dehydrogenase [bacterium]